MAKTYTIKYFDSKKAAAGSLCLMVNTQAAPPKVPGDNISDNDNTNFKGVGIARRQKDENFLFVYLGIEYTFSYIGKPVSANAEGMQLYLGELTEKSQPTTFGNVVTTSKKTVSGLTRGIGGEEQSQVEYNEYDTKEVDMVLDQLNVRDEYAMNILNGMIANIEHPEELSDNEISWYCDSAYRWAGGMMSASANSRAAVTTDTDEEVVDINNSVYGAGGTSGWTPSGTDGQVVLGDGNYKSLGDFVTTGDDQTIVGVKTFSVNQIFNGTTEYHNVQNAYNNNGSYYLKFWNTQNGSTSLIGTIGCAGFDDNISIQATDNLVLDATKVYVPSYVESVGGYKKEGHSNSEVLLAGGGTELLSNIGGWTPSGTAQQVVLGTGNYKNLSELVSVADNQNISGAKTFVSTNANVADTLSLAYGGVDFYVETGIYNGSVNLYGIIPNEDDAARLYIDAIEGVGSTKFVVYGVNNPETKLLLADGSTIAISDVGGTSIPDGSITTAKLASYAVTSAKLGYGAVDDYHIVNGAVTTVKINDGAVTTAKLNSSAVTTAKIADSNVTEAKIATGAVTTDKIDAGAVTTIKLINNAVDTSKIANNAVTNAKIANGAVSADKIARLTDNIEFGGGGIGIEFYDGTSSSATKKGEIRNIDGCIQIDCPGTIGKLYLNRANTITDDTEHVYVYQNAAYNQSSYIYSPYYIAKNGYRLRGITADNDVVLLGSGGFKLLNEFALGNTKTTLDNLLSSMSNNQSGLIVHTTTDATTQVSTFEVFREYAFQTSGLFFIDKTITVGTGTYKRTIKRPVVWLSGGIIRLLYHGTLQPVVVDDNGEFAYYSGTAFNQVADANQNQAYMVLDDIRRNAFYNYYKVSVNVNAASTTIDDHWLALAGLGELPPSTHGALRSE